MPESEAGFKWGALVFSPPPGPAASTDVRRQGDLRGQPPGARPRERARPLARVARVRRVGRDRTRQSHRPCASAVGLPLGSRRRERTAAQPDAHVVGGLPAWVLSGQAGGDAPRAPLLTIRSVQPQDSAVQPFYVTRDSYMEIRRAAMQRSWEERGARHDESWFPSWVEVDELLGRRPTRPPILGYAMLSYSSAWTRRLLEFSIPEFVRSVEGIVALPPGQGRTTFRDRSLSLVPSLRTDAYVGANVEELLVRLYVLRNDCVHGKLPFADMQARGGSGSSRSITPTCGIGRSRRGRTRPRSSTTSGKWSPANHYSWRCADPTGRCSRAAKCWRPPGRAARSGRAQRAQDASRGRQWVPGCTVPVQHV